MSKIQTRFTSELYVALNTSKTDEGRRLANRRLADMHGRNKAIAQTASLAVRLAPGCSRRFLRRPYERAGLELLGGGWHADVVRLPGDTSKVLKIDRVSRLIGAVERVEERAEQLQTKHDITARALGKFAASISYKIIEDPLQPNRRVVAGIQDYVPYVLESPATTIDESSLRDFIDTCKKMRKNTGVLPDLAMPGNIRTTKIGEVVLVDTEPLDVSGQGELAFQRTMKDSEDALSRLVGIVGE